MQPAIFGLGPLELIIIIGVIVLLFIPSVLPKLIKRFGETVETVRDMTGKDEETEEEEEEEDK